MSEMIHNAPSGPMRDPNDEGQTRHGREVHVGHVVGQYLQAPPFFFTRDKWPAPFVDMYRGGSCFLIASGPSFANIDHDKLRDPGILTLGLNNSVKTFRPKMWTCVDDPANFIRSTWLDPTIMKFVPISHIDKPLFNSDEWKFMDKRVGDCPNIWFYKRNEKFQAEQYLWEDTINWGNHTNLGGGRSVMLAAIRILFLLGIRNVFLLGVDFNMSNDYKYHFDQDRTKGSINGNNSTYQKLNERFAELRPIFEQQGFNVYNCNPTSGLTAFNHMPFDEAYDIARGILPVNLQDERTDGLYERKSKLKQQKQKQKTGNNAVDQSQERSMACDPSTNKHLQQVRNQVKVARTALHEAKDVTAALKAMSPNDPDFSEEKLKLAVADEQTKRITFRRLCEIRDRLQGRK